MFSLILPFRFRDLLLPGIYIRQWIREYIKAGLFKSLKEVGKNITFVISWVIWLMVVFVLIMRKALFIYLLLQHDILQFFGTMLLFKQNLKQIRK